MKSFLSLSAGNQLEFGLAGYAVSESGPKPELTICVVGRNEAAHLPDCARALQSLKEEGIALETLYVDSDSSDESVSIASQYFDIVIELAGSPHLNASAARALGTEYARADWVLYLDGDMRLSAEFYSVIHRQLTQISGSAGIAGLTQNLYPDSSSDFIRFPGNESGKSCRAFGGAVMLRRKAVLSAGNWALSLYSNEEVELLSRLIQHGHEVIWTDTKMVQHVTEKYKDSDKLLSNLIPYRSFLGKKFYGAGQATRLAMMQGHLVSFVRLKPQQYLMTASFAVSVLLLPFNVTLSFWPAAITFAYIAASRGPKCAINCICWSSQVIFGWGKLKLDFHPQIRNLIRRSDDKSVLS